MICPSCTVENPTDAKVIVLPFARYQLPRNMVRMDAAPLRYPEEAHAH